MEKNKQYLWEQSSKMKIQQIRDEWEWLIDTAIGHRKNMNILEIGCYDGGSSLYLSNFAKNMITIDNHNPCRFDVEKITSSSDVNYLYRGGDSHSPDQTALFSTYDWDFVFIDGDHSYDGVKADFYNVLPHLKKGTPVAFHDIVVSDSHRSQGCFVGEFWEDLKQTFKAFKFEEFKTTTDWAGIGIVWI